ncbi:DUF4031 domain-containing protein [Kineococcus sp. SYSU DK002]|uniref:DUF4031 domain-containing protein n=1 Tax=Kineococcus sp. SYSU DK002 TaxID=3383123 RepID=UPI003D7CDACE
MSVMVDTAAIPAHGRTWAHLASDTSAAELHRFARLLGIPPRACEGDHYDVPVERVPEAVALGAELVTTRELLARLRAAGLRTPKRRGEKVLSSTVVDGHRVDVVRAATVPAPHGTHRLAHLRAGRLVLTADGDLPVTPHLHATPGAGVAGFRRWWLRTPAGYDLRHDGLLVGPGAGLDAGPGAPVPATDRWWVPLLTPG